MSKSTKCSLHEGISAFLSFGSAPNFWWVKNVKTSHSWLELPLWEYWYHPSELQIVSLYRVPIFWGLFHKAPLYQGRSPSLCDELFQLRPLQKSSRVSITSLTSCHWAKSNVLRAEGWWVDQCQTWRWRNCMKLPYFWPKNVCFTESKAFVWQSQCTIWGTPCLNFLCCDQNTVDLKYSGYFTNGYIEL